MTAAAEEAAISRARLARQRCICQEAPDATPCRCPVPVTREQVGRLKAYQALDTSREVIYSEAARAWVAALRAFLSAAADGGDLIEAWLRDPFNVPSTADLRHASYLGELLDMLGAPRVAEQS